jgi:hypothetical protein
MILGPEDYNTWLSQHLASQQLTVTEPLYHYTNAAGFLGLLNEGKIWFTSLYHVNDPSEERFGLDIALDVIREFAAKDPIYKRYCDKVIKRLSHPSFGIFFEPFVACFSRDRNTLEQWRAYGDNGRGFAIGLEPIVFQVKPKRKGDYPTFITEVAYGDDAIPLIRQPIERWFDSVPRHAISADDESWLPGLTMAILWYSARTKHKAYSAEKEVRLITRRSSDAKFEKRIRFRNRGSVIVPYFEEDIKRGRHQKVRRWTRCIRCAALANCVMFTSASLTFRIGLCNVPTIIASACG